MRLTTWFGGRRAAIPAAGTLAVLLMAAPAAAAPSNQLDLSRCDPTQNEFTTQVDNPYFPLPAGGQWVYVGKEQGAGIGLRITVTGETETFYQGRDAVTTVEVEELEWEDADQDGVLDPDEPLIERSLNYYAQTTSGDVCYFGESVDIFEDGEIVSHEGAWRADDPDNAPGIFMPAEPAAGMTFQQESAPGVAEDEATITRLGQVVTVPAGTFTDTLRTRDFNPLDGSRGVKFYASGVGLIVDGPLDLVSVSP
jgi:hypothetical protein